MWALPHRHDRRRLAARKVPGKPPRLRPTPPPILHPDASRHLRAHWAGHVQPRRPRRPRACVRAQQRRRHRDRDQPPHVSRGGDVSGRGFRPARYALMGPAAAVRGQHRRELPDGDRPAHGAAGADAARARPLQPLLHARRVEGDRGRRGLPAARLLQRPHVEADRAGAHPQPRARSPRLLGRRQVAADQL